MPQGVWRGLRFGQTTPAQGKPEPLKLTHLPPGAKVRSPEPPTREQTAKLKEAALATRKEEVAADGNGTLAIARMMEPWSVVLVEQE